jgi:hypothetical protein
MQNTGTWNSDLSILFFACLLLPIAMYFLGAFLQMISPETPAQPQPAPSPPKQPKASVPTSISVSLNMPNFKGFNLASSQDRVAKAGKKSKPKSKPKSKARRKYKTTTKPEHPTTDNGIVSDATSALVGLGYKKAEAVRLVKMAISKKQYNSCESLIKDCFMCIS